MTDSILPLDDPSTSQVTKMLTLFRDSFEGEPGFRYMFQHPTRRLDDVYWSADLKFKLMRPKLDIYVANTEIDGFSWWIPPGITPFATFWQQVRVGYGVAPFRCGLREFSRMYRFSAQERELVVHYTREPIWVLDTIAVDLTKGRRGLGGKLLEPGLTLADKDGCGCFVLTHNDRNVRFYEKYGFRLDQDVELGETGVHAYCLLYGKERTA